MKISDLKLPKAVLEKAAHLLDPLKDVDLPTPTGWFVLCVQWRKPDKVGSLFMPETVKREDEFQGRSGLVIAVGPDAYQGDKYGSGPWAKVGDWVAWPAMSNAASRMRYNGVVVTALPDDQIVLRGVDPSLVS